jgi:hypothetical protein
MSWVNSAHLRPGVRISGIYLPLREFYAPGTVIKIAAGSLTVRWDWGDEEELPTATLFLLEALRT